MIHCSRLQVMGRHYSEKMFNFTRNVSRWVPTRDLLNTNHHRTEHNWSFTMRVYKSHRGRRHLGDLNVDRMIIWTWVSATLGGRGSDDPLDPFTRGTGAGYLLTSNAEIAFNRCLVRNVVKHIQPIYLN
jgi:hypothetical protein